MKKIKQKLLGRAAGVLIPVAAAVFAAGFSSCVQDPPVVVEEDNLAVSNVSVSSNSPATITVTFDGTNLGADTAKYYNILVDGTSVSTLPATQDNYLVTFDVAAGLHNVSIQDNAGTVLSESNSVGVLAVQTISNLTVTSANPETMTVAFDGTNDGASATRTFTIAVDGTVKETLTANANHYEKTLTGISAGNHSVTVTGSDGVSASGNITVAAVTVEIPQTATNLAISSTADNTLSVSFTGVVKSGATYKLMGFKDGSSTGTVLRTWTADATSYTANITGVAAGNWTFQIQDASGNILTTFANAVSVANQQVASNLSVSSSSYNTLSVSFTGEFKAGATYKLVGFKDGSTTGTVLKTWSADGASYSATIASVAAGSWTFQIQDANGNVLTSLTTAVTVSNQPSYSLTTDGYTYNAAAKTLSINNSNYTVEISGNSSITAGSTINLSSLGLTAYAYQEVTLIVKSGSTVLDTKTIPLMDKFASTSANEGPWNAAIQTFKFGALALVNSSSSAATVAVTNLAQDVGNHSTLDGDGTTTGDDSLIVAYSSASAWDTKVGEYFTDANVHPVTYDIAKTWTESLKGTDGLPVIIDNLSAILTWYTNNSATYATPAAKFKTALLQMIFNNSDLLTSAQKTTAMQALYPAMTGATISQMLGASNGMYLAMAAELGVSPEKLNKELAYNADMFETDELHFQYLMREKALQRAS